MNNTLRYTSPKLSVKDSFDEDEVSDDVEDEVFIRDGKNGFKLDEEIGVKRPLMAPRRKFKYNQLNPDRSKRSFFRKICSSYGCGLMLLTMFLGISTAAIVILCLVPNPFDKFRRWKMDEISSPVIVPCMKFKGDDMWHQSFPFYKTESALITFDSNGDNILDIVVGFSTGVTVGEMPEKCAVFESSNGRCGGGIMVLDGATGETLWKYWTLKDVLFIDCSQSVNADKTLDCLISGKGGVLCVVDGKTGHLVWEFNQPNVVRRIDLYSAQYIVDLNNDGFSEVFIAHASDQSSHMVILNGKNGEIIGQIDSPDKKSIFTVPRVILTKNSTYNVVFSTGSLDTGGALYVVGLDSVALSNMDKIVKVWNSSVGISSGLLFIDVNNDEWVDVVFSSGHSIIAMSGKDYSQLWNYTSNEANPAQILVGPTPGYFDDDSSADFLITEMIGPSFPTYYYSKTWVASGATGKPLLNEDILGSGTVNAPGITLSFSGTGNDMFLYWYTTCSVPPAQQKEPFSFSEESTLHDRTHAELCKLRFNTTMETRLYLLSQHIEPPGILLYSSKSEWDTEHNMSEALFNSAKKEEASKYKSNFRHKGQPFYPIPPENGDKEGYEYSLLPRQRWQTPQIAYDERFSMLPSVNLGDLADPYYPQSRSPQDGRDERANYGKEMKRQVSSLEPPLLSRATSTAALVNKVNGSGVDIVIATFWEPSSLNVKVFNDKQRKCIQAKITAEQNSNNMNKMEVEMAEVSAERECSGVEDEYDGYEWNDRGDSFPSGQMTVFRIKLSTNCSNLRDGEVCSQLLPYEQQSYPRRGSDIIYKSRAQPPQRFITA